MPRMLGRGVWYGVFCRGCNGPRTVKVERLREKRAWRRELLDDLAPDDEDDHP